MLKRELISWQDVATPSTLSGSGRAKRGGQEPLKTGGTTKRAPSLVRLQAGWVIGAAILMVFAGVLFGLALQERAVGCRGGNSPCFTAHQVDNSAGLGGVVLLGAVVVLIGGSVIFRGTVAPEGGASDRAGR